MDWLFIDWESYYDREFSLKKICPAEYILDERFEEICLGVAEGMTDRPFILDGPDDIDRYLKSRNPETTAAVCHSGLFDFSIASWKHRWVPRLMVDTLAMSRTLLQHKLRSLSLASVAQHFGMQKGTTIVHAMGMTRADLKANGLWPTYTDYCMNDVSLCRSIFLNLHRELPDEEFVLHDLILRMAVQPCLRLNTELLAQHLEEVRANKEALLCECESAGVEGRGDLMSNERLATILRELGVEPPTKLSLTTGERIYAFAKVDEDFISLLEDDDAAVQAVVAARLSHKSTLEETRSERMLRIADLEFPDIGTHVLPVPLNIGAAHTHRLGGTWQINAQNWGRQSKIRNAVEAQEGHSLVVADSRQIEARTNACYCGQDDLVELFRAGVDVYARFAGQIFHREVTEKTDPAGRFVGKTGILQLGYQSGPAKFQATVRYLSRSTEFPVILSDEQAQSIVQLYRALNNRISGKWYWLRDIIPFIASADPGAFHDDGPLRFSYQKIEGPTGLSLHYHNLRWDTQSEQWWYDYNGRPRRLYGGALLENIIQFLARLAVMSVPGRIVKEVRRMNAQLAHTSHDELVYSCPDPVVPDLVALLKSEMSVSPSWMPSLPLGVGIGVAKTYGGAK